MDDIIHCRDCRAWDRDKAKPPKEGGERYGYCHRHAADITPDNLGGCGESWWCLEAVSVINWASMKESMIRDESRLADADAQPRDIPSRWVGKDA